jgi:hypothetical protein
MLRNNSQTTTNAATAVEAVFLAGHITAHISTT